MRRGLLMEIWSFLALKVGLLSYQMARMLSAVMVNMQCPFLHAPLQHRNGGRIALHVLCPYVYAPSPSKECMHALLSLA